MDHKARAQGGGQNFQVTRHQLLALGEDEGSIRNRVESGEWITIQAGVYQIDSRPRTWEDNLVAAILAAGTEAAASHRAALVLWKLDGISSAPVEITVPHTHGPVPVRTILHRTRRPVQVTTIDGIPVTIVERTLLDCCSSLQSLAATKAFESAFRKRLTTVDVMYQFLKEQGGRGVKGTRLARRILDNRRDDTPTGSGSETEALFQMRNGGIPEPVLQHELTAADGDTIRPDFFWPRLGKAVEVDGVDAHDSADNLDHDLQRQNKLLDLGIELRRFSARLVRRDPARFVAEVERFLDA